MFDSGVEVFHGRAINDERLMRVRVIQLWLMVSLEHSDTLSECELCTDGASSSNSSPYKRHANSSVSHFWAMSMASLRISCYKIRRDDRGER